eukprot:CAMPEP_0172201440 /NCGR_PEP_ID=MMETSP1050-20130122/30004_1 /TAXON_ID=233186 /ORGANISM="Cryptomonas curvata, Strain CCAP979/52" /LENGTH=437 /DNA_ID=CAMNT_0012879093 /DNA_START=1160 /DNA_END=2473 /DNA_ORIENTATION=-
MCRSSKSVETESFNPLRLMNAGSNDAEIEPGLSWGSWSVRKHGMLLSIDSGLRKLVLTNDGFVLSDSSGGFVVEDGVEKVLSRLESDKHIAQAESSARTAYARHNSPKSLEALVGELEVSSAVRTATLEVLRRELLTVEQLLTCVTDEELDHVGVLPGARLAIRALRVRVYGKQDETTWRWENLSDITRCLAHGVPPYTPSPQPSGGSLHYQQLCAGLRSFASLPDPPPLFSSAGWHELGGPSSPPPGSTAPTLCHASFACPRPLGGSGSALLPSADRQWAPLRPSPSTFQGPVPPPSGGLDPSCPPPQAGCQLGAACSPPPTYCDAPCQPPPPSWGTSAACPPPRAGWDAAFLPTPPADCGVASLPLPAGWDAACLPPPAGWGAARAKSPPEPALGVIRGYIAQSHWAVGPRLPPQPAAAALREESPPPGPRTTQY